MRVTKLEQGRLLAELGNFQLIIESAENHNIKWTPANGDRIGLAVIQELKRDISAPTRGVISDIVDSLASIDIDLSFKEVKKICNRILTEIKNNKTLLSTLFDKWEEATNAVADVKDHEFSNEAIELARDPKILWRIKKVLDKAIVGEDDTKLLLFLIFLSKEVDPQAVYLVAESSTGKSYLQTQISKIFKEDVLHYTRITPGAIDRIGGDITGKVLVIGEDAGLGPEASSILRQWLSEGELSLLTPEKTDDGKIRNIEIKTKGKPVLVTTTTKGSIDPELATRIWIITPDTSEEQTKRILEFEALKAEGLINGEAEKEFEMIKEALSYIKDQCKGCEIRVPYARKMAEKFPIERVRARRDFSKILALIKVSAWLHQLNRPVIEKDGKRIVIATLADLGVVSSIVLKSIKPTLTGLTPIHEKILKLAEAHDEFSIYDMAPRLKLSAKRVYDLVRELCDFGYLEKTQGGPGKKNLYQRVLAYENNGEFPTISDGNLPYFFTDKELSEWLDSTFSPSNGVKEDICREFRANIYDPLAGVSYISHQIPPEGEKVESGEGEPAKQSTDDAEIPSEAIRNSDKSIAENKTAENKELSQKELIRLIKEYYHNTGGQSENPRQITFITLCHSYLTKKLRYSVDRDRVKEAVEHLVGDGKLFFQEVG